MDDRRSLKLENMNRLSKCGKCQFMYKVRTSEVNLFPYPFLWCLSLRRVMHICAGNLIITGSDYDLSPGGSQAII